MKNASREVSRFYVEVMDDSKMNSQTAVLTITNNDLLIEGEQTLSILRTQIRKVQRFLNAGWIQADAGSGKPQGKESDLALTVAGTSGVDRLLFIRVLKNEGIQAESLFEQLCQ